MQLKFCLESKSHVSVHIIIKEGRTEGGREGGRMKERKKGRKERKTQGRSDQMARMVEVGNEVNGVRLEGEWGRSGIGQGSGLGQQLGDYPKCNGKLSRF